MSFGKKTNSRPTRGKSAPRAAWPKRAKHGARGAKPYHDMVPGGREERARTRSDRDRKATLPRGKKERPAHPMREAAPLTGELPKKRTDVFNRKDRAEASRRPRIKRGPWSDNAYLPSPKITPMDGSAKKRRPENTKPDPLEIMAKRSKDKERLQKVLARCGVSSRRKAEMLILEGAVTVNGRLATELGVKVDATKDKIKVHGNLIYTQVEPIFLALYKPKGMISALSDPEGRRTIGHIVKSLRERVIPIGRLDFNSEGLILLTNDGNLAEAIIKTRELSKVYMVKIKGHPTPDDLAFLKRGFFSEEGVVRFASFGVEQTLRSKSWLKLEVTEGARLDLREMLNHKGLLVDRIVRTAIGPISIKGLQPGEYRFMKRADFEKLLTSANNKR